MKKTKYSMFSDMEWLGKEIKRNQESPGRNSLSDLYYDTLLKIRTAQDKKEITDEQYLKFSYLCGGSTQEEGYYFSNIHYDLYKMNDGIENIEDRIIHFLEVSNPFIIKNSSSLKDEFIRDFSFFIKQRKNLDNCNSSNNLWLIKKYGTPLECEILDKFIELTNIERPIIYKIKISKYNQIVKLMETLIIDFNGFGFYKAPLMNDGKIFRKKGLYQEKNIKNTYIDEIFDFIYNLVSSYQNKIGTQRKDSAECLEIEITTENGLKKFMFTDDIMEIVTAKIADLVSKHFDDLCYLNFLINKNVLIEA